MKLLKNFFWFLLWMGVILYLSFTPLTNWPKEDFFQKLYFDKLVHISMYSMLSLLLLRCIFKQQNNSYTRNSTILTAVLVCALLGAASEVLQPLLTRFRQFELLDMAANATGAVCGFFLFSFLLNRKWLGIKARTVN